MVTVTVTVSPAVTDAKFTPHRSPTFAASAQARANCNCNCTRDCNYNCACDYNCICDCTCDCDCTCTCTCDCDCDCVLRAAPARAVTFMARAKATGEKSAQRCTTSALASNCSSGMMATLPITVSAIATVAVAI
eukprot:4663872-Pyramimonas_sp.AAC.1